MASEVYYILSILNFKFSFSLSVINNITVVSDHILYRWQESLAMRVHTLIYRYVVLFSFVLFASYLPFNDKDIKTLYVKVILVTTYPSAGGRRVTRGMRVPSKEYARSRHQRLFEENVGKTGRDAIYELLS